MSSSPPLKIYPVVVGVDHYLASTAEQSFDLQCAARDATRLTQFLQEPNLAFTTVAFTPFLNEQATAEGIRQALRMRWGSYRLGAGDVLLFYFAGHGVVTPEDRAYLCCTDTNFRDPHSGGLGLDELYDDMQRVAAETVIVVLDACFSGRLLDPATVNQRPAQQMRALLSHTLPQTVGNRVILAAAHANQKARENPLLDGGAGIFTDTLLRGWRDGEARQADGVVTAESLAGYLRQQFVNFADQQPVTLVAGGAVLSIGRFPERPPADLAAPTTPLRRAGAFDPTQSVTPISKPAPLPPPRPPMDRRRLLIAAGASVAALAVCATLEIVSPQLFILTFIGACLLALASIPLARPFSGLAALLAVVQAVLLVGVLHLRFGVGEGVAALDTLAQYAWLAIPIILFQLAVVLYRIADFFTSS
jgi:hypothetical protein